MDMMKSAAGFDAANYLSLPADFRKRFAKRETYPLVAYGKRSELGQLNKGIWILTIMS